MDWLQWRDASSPRRLPLSAKSFIFRNTALIRLTMDTSSTIARFRSASVVAYRLICNLTEREKKHLLHEILQVRGLMPLLMKPRNKQLWTAEDKEELRIHLRRLSSNSAYMIVLTLSGSSLMLSALAGWLDRRRNYRLPSRGFCKARLDKGRLDKGQTKSILDRSFRYTPSAKTDLRKTFAKLRRDQRLTNGPNAKGSENSAKMVSLKKL